MSAVLLPHRARIVRCWRIAQVSAGQWQGRVVSRVERVDVRTAVGSFFLVEDAVRNGGRYRGLPVHVTLGLPRKAITAASPAGDF